jgi:hypothetical protein
MFVQSTQTLTWPKCEGIGSTSYPLRCWQTKCLVRCMDKLTCRHTWACWYLRDIFCNTECRGAPRSILCRANSKRQLTIRNVIGNTTLRSYQCLIFTYLVGIFWGLYVRFVEVEDAEFAYGSQLYHVETSKLGKCDKYNNKDSSSTVSTCTLPWKPRKPRKRVYLEWPESLCTVECHYRRIHSERFFINV